MALILRIDVDKPYGRENMRQKVLSKLREDFWFPPVSFLGYLQDLRNLLLFLGEFKISSHIYFRKCTFPPKQWLNGPLFEGHKLGLHAENTRNIETFKREMEEIQGYFKPREITSFTKHGSGGWKGGRNHYPPYEPDKYLEWGDDVGMPFLFGNNENIDESCKPHGVHQYYPGALWIDRPYANYDHSALKNVVERAKESDLIVIMHNGCFEVDRRTEEAMRYLIVTAREQNVDWITL